MSNDLLKTKKYKNHTINIYRENEYNPQSNPRNESFGIILINDKFYDKLNLLSEFSGPVYTFSLQKLLTKFTNKSQLLTENILFCEEEIINELKNEKDCIYIDLYNRKYSITTESKKNYCKIGIMFGMKSNFERHKKFQSDCKNFENTNVTLDVFEEYYFAKEILRKEVQIFDNFVNHRIYGCEIISPENVKLSSCWGYNASAFCVKDLMQE